MAYGRPMKGKTRRVQITVHVSVGALDAIDEYLEERNEKDGTKVSRSDFINEAIEAHVKKMGLMEGPGSEVAQE